LRTVAAQATSLEVGGTIGLAPSFFSGAA